MSRLIAAGLAATLTVGVLAAATRHDPAPAGRVATSPALAAAVAPLTRDLPRLRAVHLRASRSLTRRPVHAPRPVARTSVSAQPAPPVLASSGGLDWDAVARCESGGDWHINTGNGYYGGLQMNAEFWRDWGGLAYAARPDLASRAVQITVATRAYRRRGSEPWPVCGRYL